VHPGNGKVPTMCTVHDDSLLQIGDRLDEHDGKFGAILRELGDISETSSKTYAAALRAADESTAVRGELQEERLQRRRECDLRHEGVNARLTLAEKDEWDDKSGVTYEPAILAVRYDERGAELERVRATLEEVRRAEQTRWTRIKWGAGIVTGIISTVGAVLAAIYGG
jgi:hypothetical protein